MDWPTFIRTGEAVQAASCRPLEQKYDLIRTVEFAVCCRKSVVINWQNSNPNYYCDLLPSHHKTSVSKRQRLNQAKNGQFISNIDFGRYGICFCFNYSTLWQGTNQRHRLPGLHSQPLQLRHWRIAQVLRKSLIKRASRKCYRSRKKCVCFMSFSTTFDENDDYCTFLCTVGYAEQCKYFVYDYPNKQCDIYGSEAKDNFR